MVYNTVQEIYTLSKLQRCIERMSQVVRKVIDLILKA